MTISRKKIRDLNTHRGVPNRVPAGAAQAHIALLRETLSWTDVSSLTGCSAAHLREIATGRRTVINRLTQDKILAARPSGDLSGGLYIDATGSARRVRALMAIGHPQRVIGAHARTTQYRIGWLAMGQPLMRAKCAAKIAAAYEELADVRGTSTRARNMAARAGWPDPTWWEDWGHLDDPEFDPATAEQPQRGRTWLTDEISHLAGCGVSTRKIAAQVGRTEKYVRQVITGERGPGWRQQDREAA